MIGLELGELSVDCCITKAPCGGEAAGRSPVDRGKQDQKRSVASEARGVPLGLIPAGPTGMTRPCWCRPWKPRRPRLGRCPSR